jgi:hypothetical protein
MGRGKAAKTREIIETSVEILTESKFPLTIRRLYYELISKGVIVNSPASELDLADNLGETPTYRTQTGIRVGEDFECNRDLYEAAGAADATACSRIGSWGGLR